MMNTKKWMASSCKMVIVLVLLCFVHLPKSMAQFQNVWAFGDGAGLDFNTIPPTPMETSIYSTEACASVCDTLGNLLFYTDGNRVWNRNHQLMPYGDNLSPFGANSTTQGAIIVPMPGSNFKYYIFSLTCWEAGLQNLGKLNYSIVDMSLNNQSGDVDRLHKGIPLDSFLGEQMTSVAGDACNVWLLTIARNGFLKAYSIDAHGISEPVLSPVTNPIVTDTMRDALIFGSLDVSPDRTKLALGRENAPTGTSRKGRLTLYDFNVHTGAVNNEKVLDSILSFYDVCFSPDNSQLYANVSADRRFDYFSLILQFDIRSDTALSIMDSRVSIYDSRKNSERKPVPSAMQRGPDGKIYIALNNNYPRLDSSRNLDIIRQPNLRGPACQYTVNGLSVSFPGNAQSLVGLPNVITYIIDKKDTVYTSTRDTAVCFSLGHTIAAPNTKGRKYLWNTGDSASSLKVDTGGLYWVEYYVECTYYIDSFAVYFPSRPLDFEVQASCSNYANGRAWILKTSGDTTTYFYAWRAEADTLVLSKTDSLSSAPAGKYIINVTTISGCQKVISLTIPEDNYQVSFNADTLLCAGDTVFFQNTSDGHFQTWHWSFGDSTSTSQRQEEHAYHEEGRYKVILVGEGPLCYDTAYTTIIVDAPAEDISLEVTPYAVCQGETIHFKAKIPKIPVRILWDFGDEYRMTTQSVGDMQHAYDNSGGKWVILKASYRVCPELTYQDSVVVYALPKIYLGPDSVLCLNGSSLILKNHYAASVAMTTHLWNTGETTEMIKARHPGIYSLTLSEAPLGCSATESIEVKKDCYTDVPNVFTPNGDGLNDYFFPRQLIAKGIKSFRMAVFNRWGGKVFETQSMEGRGWDGNFNDQPQSQGVYVYQIEVELENSQFERYDGNITLLR